MPTEDRKAEHNPNSINASIINKALVELYPNPVENILTVEYILPNSSVNTLNIYDINGSLMQQHSIANEMGIEGINVSQLTSGVYIMQLGSENREFIVK